MSSLRSNTLWKELAQFLRSLATSKKKREREKNIKRVQQIVPSFRRAGRLQRAMNLGSK